MRLMTLACTLSLRLSGSGAPPGRCSEITVLTSPPLIFVLWRSTPSGVFPEFNVFPKLGFALILMLGEHLDNDGAVAGINLKVWCGIIFYGDRLYLEACFQESAVGAQFGERSGCFFGIIHTAKARSKGTKPSIVTLVGDTGDRSVGEVVDRARFRVEDRIPRRKPTRRNQRCGVNGFKLFVRKQITYSPEFHG